MNKVRKYIFFSIFMTLLLANIDVYAQNEPIESVIKRAISEGIMKRDNSTLIYMAAPGQDTVKIRNEYEGLIKKSGKPYTFQFDSKMPKQQKNITPKENNVPQQIYNPQPNQVNTTIRQTAVDQGSACFARQNVFGVLHYTDRTENYTWIVPDGVTQIWIEAWSGGGNGYSAFTYNPADAAQIYDIAGGGGGGGAYASAMIQVEKGEKIIITIPASGGGKTVEILLNDKTNALYLNNGANGNADDALRGGGNGGVLGGNYGRFANNNVFWTSGQNGGTLENAFYDYSPSHKDFLGNTVIGKNDIQIGNFGNGGSAARLNNGVRGAQLNYTSFHRYASGQNGGFPGGGGGGGIGSNTGYNLGKGAPGEVIIHY